MAAYNPNAVICINENIISGDLIVNNITIIGGRSNVDEQPRASVCNISLIDVNGVVPEIDLNQCLRVEVDNSDAEKTQIFKGFITDVTPTVVNSVSGALVIEYQLTAVSPLARLGVYETEGAYAKEFDGDRVFNVLSDAILTKWEDVPPAETWADVDPSLTWATYDPNNFIGFIDRPGDYELVKYEGGVTNAKSLLENVANSALGILYEKNDGTVNYDSASARIARTIENGFNTLSVEHCQGAGLFVAKRLGNIYNEFKIGYKNGQVFAEDLTSKTLYGLNAGGRDTLLENEGDAETQATHYIRTRAYPRQTIDTINVPLHNEALPDATRDLLLNLFCGVPLQIPDLPNTLGGSFVGFIEGYTYTITNKTMFCNLKLSPFEMSQIPQSWGAVDGAITWDDVQLTLTWADAKVVN